MGNSLLTMRAHGCILCSEAERRVIAVSTTRYEAAFTLGWLREIYSLFQNMKLSTSMKYGQGWKREVRDMYSIALTVLGTFAALYVVITITDYLVWFLQK